MTLITSAYAAEQKRLHASDAAYGSRGYYWAYLVAGIAAVEGCRSILDYGCGKGTMGHTLRGAGLDVREYDPGVAGRETQPEPADLVVSVDVLEHVEPDSVEDVLEHLARLCRRQMFVAISTIPSKRQLSDGRNTHLVVREGDWWRQMFEANGFEVRRVWRTGQPEWVALMDKSR